MTTYCLIVFAAASIGCCLGFVLAALFHVGGST